MNRLLSLIGSVVLLTCAPLAKAYFVEDIVTFNRVLQVNDVLVWSHDLTKYGYVPGTRNSQFSLTLETRDLDDTPGKDDNARPFYMLSQGQGRSYGRVLMEDMVKREGSVIHIEPNGMVRPLFTILEGEVWIGRAIARVNIPDPVVLPEPSSLWLLLLGLSLMAARLRPTHF